MTAGRLEPSLGTTNILEVLQPVEQQPLGELVRRRVLVAAELREKIAQHVGQIE